MISALNPPLATDRARGYPRGDNSMHPTCSSLSNVVSPFMRVTNQTLSFICYTYVAIRLYSCVNDIRSLQHVPGPKATGEREGRCKIYTNIRSVNKATCEWCNLAGIHAHTRGSPTDACQG